MTSDLLQGLFERRAVEGDLSGVLLLDEPRAALRARLACASLARKTLDLQYYLWKGDATGGVLLDRVLAAADRGVAVRILIDDIYHLGRDADYAAIDAHPDVEVRIFNPIGRRRLGRGLDFVVNKRWLNNRMHNKVFLADDAVVILGGRNIGDDYFGVDPKLNFRDLDVLAAGAAAGHARAAFDLYWNSRYARPIRELYRRRADLRKLAVLRRKLAGELDKRGARRFAVPGTFEEIGVELDSMRRGLTLARTEIVVDPVERFEGGTESALVRLGRDLLAEVRRDVVIQTAYLIPDAAAVETMARLTARGVRVRLMTNSLMSNNHFAVHAYYSKYRRSMLEAGVELHELRSDAALAEFLRGARGLAAGSHAGLHTKMALLDRQTTFIGSFNMDPRSRLFNSEIGLLIHGPEFAAVVAKAIEPDFAPENSYRVTLDPSGGLRWRAVSPEGPVEHTDEPDATRWRRLMAGLIRWLPIEREL